MLDIEFSTNLIKLSKSLYCKVLISNYGFNNELPRMKNDPNYTKSR